MLQKPSLHRDWQVSYAVKADVRLSQKSWKFVGRVYAEEILSPPGLGMQCTSSNGLQGNVQKSVGIS